MQRAGTGRAGGGQLRSHHQSWPGIQTECKHTWVPPETVLGCWPTEERACSVCKSSWTRTNHAPFVNERSDPIVTWPLTRPLLITSFILAPRCILWLWTNHGGSKAQLFSGDVLRLCAPHSWASDCSDLSKLIREGIYWSPRWEWWINNETKQKIKSVIGDN